MNLPKGFRGEWLPGWYLIGEFDSGVGSWLLHDDGEAMLLEVPEGLTVKDVQKALDRLELKLRYVTTSHDHYDHLERDAWSYLAEAFQKTKFIHPASVRRDRRLRIGSEVAWLVAGPKHSLADVVTVFRGGAMTGDVELGMLRTAFNEVPLRTRKKSMDWFRGFPERTGYQVHTTVSAHLNSVRTNVKWHDLFSYAEE